MSQCEDGARRKELRQHTAVRSQLDQAEAFRVGDPDRLRSREREVDRRPLLVAGSYTMGRRSLPPAKGKIYHERDDPMFSLPNLDSTLSTLSAMITPVVMILAVSSLILTTRNRLLRVVDRVREMLPELEKLVQTEQRDEAKVAMLFADLERATVRTRLGQQALAQLYLALGTFLATSIALGVVTYARFDAGLVPLLLGAIGVALLFSASILLILESRIALASAYAEMDYIRLISGHLAPPELRKTHRSRLFR